MQLHKVAKSEGRTKSEGLNKMQRSKEKVTTYYGLSKHLLILAMKMARITITKNGYRDNVAHALSLSRVDQGGLLDLMFCSCRLVKLYS